MVCYAVSINHDYGIHFKFGFDNNLIRVFSG